MHRNEDESLKHLGPQWYAPTLEDEGGELERTDEDLGINLEALKKAFE